MPKQHKYTLIGVIWVLFWSELVFSLEYDKCPNTWASTSLRIELANLMSLGDAPINRRIAPRRRILVEALDVRAQLRRLSVRGSSPKFDFADVGKCGLLWYDYDLSEHYFAELFPSLVCAGERVAGAARIRKSLVDLDEQIEFDRVEFRFDSAAIYVNISDHQGNAKKIVIADCSLEEGQWGQGEAQEERASKPRPKHEAPDSSIRCPNPQDRQKRQDQSDGT